MKLCLRHAVAPALTLVATLLATAARADDVLHVGAAQLDPPTVVALGVQLLITGDDNHTATVTVRYRPTGTTAWRTALPLFRVRPENVTGLAVPSEFAGSIFDLTPATAYDIELHAVDADGAIDQTVSVSGTTRAVPAADPAAPADKMVTDPSTLNAALTAAQPGDVIHLTNGTYAGQFAIHASGTEANPIVIRGGTEDGVVLDGGGCTGCNVLEVYGSFVHVENLTIAHASRALRFQGIGSDSNVVRRVHIKDTILGIGSNPDQKNFYLCDNILEGRLTWPMVYSDDAGLHSNDDGINVQGNGHVVCHNRISGYGDAMKVEQTGARAADFYGNDILTAYDNGLELDGTSGNGRCFRNRFTNTYATLSYQPIFGGPAYTFRNIVVNVANEQMKFHANGVNEPSGMLVFHNTFVSPGDALNLQTTAASHHFTIENNLFVSATSAAGRTMDWTGVIDDGTFDYDGFFPDGIVDFDYLGAGYAKYTDFASARAAGVGFEPHGLVLSTPIFASGLIAPADYKTALSPPDVTLAGGSNAIDHGLVLANINDGFQGAGPDLGALETGCPQPIYGPRPMGTDEMNEPLGCGSPLPDGGVGGAGGTAGTGGSSGGVATGGGGGTNGAGGTTGASGTGAGAAGGVGATGTGGRGTGESGSSAAAARSGDNGGCGCRTTTSAARRGTEFIAIAGLLLLVSMRRRKP
jgi:MYXO-CTERM domain-containing protein